MMMKIKSKYLNCEFDVEITDTVIDGRKVNLIPHSTLTDIFYNQLPREKGIRHEIDMTHISLAHCVAKCTIIDNDGRRIIEIGESVRAMLKTEIAKSIPATMAQIRAFDRAVIRYLDIPDKNMYAEEEFNVDAENGQNVEKKGADNKQKKEEKELLEEALLSDDIGENAVIEDFALTDLDDSAAEIPAFIEKETAQAEASGQTGGDRERAGATIVNFGKFMNKGMTVAQICDKPQNLEWAKWAIRQTGDTKEKKAQIEAIKLYIGE